MIFEPLFDADSSTWTYLIGDRAAKVAVLVDPVLEQLERDRARLAANGVALVQVIETHVHADHITAAHAHGVRAVIHASSPVTVEAKRVADGDAIAVGEIPLEVIHTPGHTPESMSLRLRDRVLTGDSLLIGTAARTDFQNGDAGSLFDAVHSRLFSLPDATLVYPGHDYEGRVCSTIAVEKTANARLSGRTRTDFIALMASLKLPPPRRIKEAVPANLRLGAPS